MQSGPIIVVFSWRWDFYDPGADRFFRSFRATRFIIGTQGSAKPPPWAKFLRAFGVLKRSRRSGRPGAFATVGGAALVHPSAEKENRWSCRVHKGFPPHRPAFLRLFLCGFRCELRDQPLAVTLSP
jgi:hypothetical protein